MARKKAKKTEIVVVQDRSGSMQTIKDDMVGGFMKFIEEQKKIDAPCTVSLYQFDDEFETVYEGVPLVEVNKLELEPRGMTALLDGVGKSITLIKERHAKLPKTKKPDQVVLVVITDGHENASREFTRATLAAKLKEVQQASCGTCGHEKDGWQVVFLGANIDSFGEATSLGISSAATANWTTDTVGTRAVYSAMNKSIGAYRSGNVRSVSLNASKDSAGNLVDDENFTIDTGDNT